MDGKEATKERRDRKERRGGIREEEIGGNGEIGRNEGVGKGRVKKGREEGKQTRRGGEKGKREKKRRRGKKREEREEGDKLKEGRRQMLLNTKRLK